MDYSTELQGKTALVTGATRGIGRAIALELAARGAVVVGTATSESGAAAITEALAPFGGRGVVLDVTNAEACDALIDALGKESGGPHILVNNAGITRDTLAMRMKDDDWSAVIDTNLASVFRLSRGVLRNMMKARWGRIINVTSVVGSSGNPGQANYAAAKAGVAGMARALARELGSRNITVNCVAPGFIDTDMTRALGETQTRRCCSRFRWAAWARLPTSRTRSHFVRPASGLHYRHHPASTAGCTCNKSRNAHIGPPAGWGPARGSRGCIAHRLPAPSRRQISGRCNFVTAGRCFTLRLAIIRGIFPIWRSAWKASNSASRRSSLNNLA